MSMPDHIGDANKMVIDDAYLAERERLAEAATKGPWVYDDGVRGGSRPDDYPWEEHGGRMLASKVAGHDIIIDEHGFDLDADGAFIADARTAVPALIAEVRRLRESEREADAFLSTEAMERLLTLVFGCVKPRFWIGGARAAFISAAAAEIERLREENAALRAENEKLRGLLKATAQATSTQLGAALGAVDGEHERLRAENAAIQRANKELNRLIDDEIRGRMGPA